jgi:hypothetical protein
VANIKNIYRFLDGSGTVLTDLKGSANGTLEGTILPTWVANGYLNFTGGHDTSTGNYNRVRFANRAVFDYSYNSIFSICVIFKSSKLDAAIHSLFNNRNLGNNGFITIQITANETINIRMTDTNGKNKISSPLGNICDGKWHIVVLTYNNNTALFYLDSKLLSLYSNDVCNGNFYSANNKATLGVMTNGATYIYDLTGSICHFANYSIALSQAQVIDIQNEFNGII